MWRLADVQHTIAPHYHSYEVIPETDWDVAQGRMAPNQQTDQNNNVIAEINKMRLNICDLFFEI